MNIQSLKKKAHCPRATKASTTSAEFDCTSRKRYKNLVLMSKKYNLLAGFNPAFYKMDSLQLREI